MIDLINKTNSPLQAKFIMRLNQNKISRTENPSSHFCCFFVPIDIKNKIVFIGHHRKSNLWLFNGGHMETCETPQETIAREMLEEWGYQPVDPSSLKPEYLSYVQIENPRQVCKEHFDIWYFIPLIKSDFHPDASLLAQEFYETKWLNIPDAKKLCVGQYSEQALEFIENKYFRKIKKK